jgi:hypothetical protein
MTTSGAASQLAPAASQLAPTNCRPTLAHTYRQIDMGCNVCS